MKPPERTMNKHFTAWAALPCAGLAQAQSSHGLSGASHWHAVDIGAMLALALAAVLAFAAVLGLGLRRLRHTPGPR